MKHRVAAVVAAVVVTVTAGTLAGKGEVGEFKGGDVEKWAQSFSVEVRETLVENWNWTGDNAAKISALEQRVAQLEARAHTAQQNRPQQGQSQDSESTDGDSSSSRQKRSEGSENPPDGSQQGSAPEDSPTSNRADPGQEPTERPKKSCTKWGRTFEHGETIYGEWYRSGSRPNPGGPGQQYQYSRAIASCNDGEARHAGAQQEWRNE